MVLQKFENVTQFVFFKMFCDILLESCSLFIRRFFFRTKLKLIILFENIFSLAVFMSCLTFYMTDYIAQSLYNNVAETDRSLSFRKIYGKALGLFTFSETSYYLV